MPPKKPVPAKPAAKTPVKAAAAKPAAGRGAPAKRGAPAAGAKKGAAPAAGKGKTEPPKPKEKVWTKEDTAARTIQTKFRQFRAKKILAEKKKLKEDYNELMDKLEKEAFLKIIKMEQEEAERQRKKEEEERRRRLEETKRKKRMLEASFEGDNDEILTILQEVVDLHNKSGAPDDSIGNAMKNKRLMNLIECEDANENTPLSEAANGGNADTVKLLLEKGADPNTQGQFLRTPLYRAAFAGHMEACQILLQNGADPRIYANDSQTPEQIASQPAIVELLKGWDITQTESLLTKLEAAKEQRLEEERKRIEAEQSKMEAQLDKIQEEYDILQKQMNKAYEELNKRITEHDQAVHSGFDRPEITLQAVHDAEDELEIIKLNAEKAREKLSLAKLELREQMKAGQAALGEEELPGLKVLVKELDDVLLRDVGNKIEDSGKWPLIIDPAAQAATFLRYRDTNYINALSPAQMEKDKSRLCILGAIRYGKPLVLDMMEVDMFDTVGMKFDDIMTGLMDKIMDKSILEEENYLQLVKKEDGTAYERNQFNDMRTKRFRFFIITKNPFPPESLLEKTYPIRMYVPT